MTGLYICQVAVCGIDARGEYVELANDGSLPAPLTDMELSNYAASQRHTLVYLFPALTDGSPLLLEPGEHAYVFTGSGISELRTGHWLLFAGLEAPVWGNGGGVAYLRNTAGQIVDSLAAGNRRETPAQG